MRFPKFRYALLSGAVLGVIVPIASMIYVSSLAFRIAPEWMLFVWPSHIMLMATENLGHSPQAFAILGMSIGANVLLYVLAFTFIWCVAWVIRAWRTSLRDGTTI
jgi:hypothetical protein